MFDELCKALDHSLSHLPCGRTFLIRDCAEIDGCFLLYHFISLFYRATRKVVLVCIQNTPRHYSVALARFGVQMERAVENGTIVLVDFSSTLSKWNGQEPAKLLENLTEELSRATCPFKGSNEQSLLVVDCLYTLHHLNSPPSSLCTFILTCVHTVGPNSCLVMKTCAECSTNLEAICLRLSDDVLDVAPLETGSGNDLNCQLNIRRRQKDKLLFENRKLLACLHERNVRFFNPGLVPGVAI
ncbi:Elongator complex protein 6 [Trichuris trichiura]|uniref:Elongator complex protein 6 n=1 Tax=Trichuris trichiura TaxID=36087 RepID=A0A077ZEE8_TRITR|nr:Elongator complex protein 6 [Trichuris trichiura]